MNILTRRSFLSMGAKTALGVALGSMLNVPGFLRKAMADNAQITWNGNKILFVFLRGGNDALNTIIPLGDPAYAQVRPTIRIPAPSDALTTGGLAPEVPEAGRAIDLGNGFAGLHAGMQDIIPVYNAGEIAIIHRVGYPFQSRSHFDSQRYWETGFPSDNTDRDGIFYRTLVETGLHQSQVMPAVSFQSTMPLLIKGDVPFANINNPARFDLLGVYAAARQKHIDSIARMHGLPYAQKQSRDVVIPAGDRFVTSIDQIRSINFQDNDSARFLDPATGYHLFQINSTSSNEKLFNSSSARSFFTSLKYSAQVLAETDAVISGCELDGFDTHNAQGSLTGGHASRMAWLAWAMYGIKQYLSHPDVNLWHKTVVVTMTEFGRTTVENGSRGTDHAEAGVMLVAGGNVNGGAYQCDPNDPVTPWIPGLTGTMFGVNGRYLKRSVDYRSVLGELIRDHLGASQAHLNAIIPGYADPGEFLQTGGTAPDETVIRGELGLLS